MLFVISLTRINLDKAPRQRRGHPAGPHNNSCNEQNDVAYIARCVRQLGESLSRAAPRFRPVRRGGTLSGLSSDWGDPRQEIVMGILVRTRTSGRRSAVEP